MYCVLSMRGADYRTNRAVPGAPRGRLHQVVRAHHADPGRLAIARGGTVILTESDSKTARLVCRLLRDGSQ
jgi:hypothetical protein